MTGAMQKLFNPKVLKRLAEQEAVEPDDDPFDMSYMFEKIKPQFTVAKTYGFKSVNREEMNNIVNRLQKNTYNSGLYQDEVHRKRPSPPRPPSAICPKAGSREREMGRSFRPASVDVREVTRRLRASTRASRAQSGQLNSDDEEEEEDSNPRCRMPASAKERKKLLARISRPTSASENHRFFNYDPERFCVQPDPQRRPEEVEEIVQRVRTPTHSSTGGQTICYKGNLTRARSRTPSTAVLFSGMPRSATVQEIVDRLYSPHRRRTPSETAISHHYRL